MWSSRVWRYVYRQRALKRPSVCSYYDDRVSDKLWTHDNMRALENFTSEVIAYETRKIYKVKKTSQTSASNIMIPQGY